MFTKIIGRSKVLFFSFRFIIKNIPTWSISIHSSREGRYKRFDLFRDLFRYFNPLIPRREIQQYCIKIFHYIFAVLPKIIRFPCLLFQKFSNFLLLTEKSDSYPSANHLQFSCELPVRTIIMLSINTYYFQTTSPLSSVHISYQKGNNLMFLHVKKKSTENCALYPSETRQYLL